MLNSDEQKLLNRKKKRSSSYSQKSHKSIGLEDFVFSNRSNSAFTIRHCSNYKKFAEYFSQIKNPYYTTDSKFLESSGIFAALKNKDNLNKEIKYSISLDKIDKSIIFPIPLSRDFFQNNNKIKTGNFIFSNLFDDEEKNEEKIFYDIHNFNNFYYLSCKISDFCPDHEKHFKFNNIDAFYEIKKDDLFIKSMKVFHYHKHGICHFHAPKGTGKSILFRSIFVNFNNYQEDPDGYAPLMFFDIKLLNDLINKSDLSEIKKILLY